MDTAPLDSFLGGYKTYITAGFGVVFNLLAVFGVWTPTPDQITAVNGVALLLAAIFLRMGVRKAQTAAEQK